MIHESISREEFFHAIDGLTEGTQGIQDRLDILNGRTRSLEVASGIMWMLWVLLGSGLGMAYAYVIR